MFIKIISFITLNHNYYNGCYLRNMKNLKIHVINKSLLIFLEKFGYTYYNLGLLGLLMLNNLIGQKFKFMHHYAMSKFFFI